jgi:two-component system, NtrC family, response regulator GlrR
MSAETEEMHQPLPRARAVAAWRLRRARGEPVEVRAEPVRCGSNPGNDVVLDHPTVSRVHAELTAVEQGVRVRDLGSTNGTKVNGVTVVEAVAAPGMVVAFGAVELEVAESGGKVEQALSGSDRFGPLVGKSAPMRALFRTLGQVAATSSTVLLQAESGCGKELVARALHDAGPRKEGPWVVFDCAGVAPSLIESALFGHEKGAFTGAVSRRAGVFEEAQGGTLFIDEIGELPLDQQPRLLRALESREIRRVGGTQAIPVDVRVIAATHRDLAREVNRGLFREDLYFRLAVVRLRIPPLRERPEDLPLLVEHLVRQALGPDEARAKAMLAGMGEAQWARLRGYHWRGNVRELRNAVERSLAMAQPVVEPPSSAGHPEPLSAPGGVSLERPFQEQRQALLERFEREYLRGMLDKHQGNFSRAAAAAGLDRMYFKRLLQKYER